MDGSEEFHEREGVIIGFNVNGLPIIFIPQEKPGIRSYIMLEDMGKVTKVPCSELTIPFRTLRYDEKKRYVNISYIPFYVSMLFGYGDVDEFLPAIQGLEGEK